MQMQHAALDPHVRPTGVNDWLDVAEPPQAQLARVVPTMGCVPGEPSVSRGKQPADAS
jgi:hypothetical protein